MPKDLQKGFTPVREDYEVVQSDKALQTGLYVKKVAVALFDATGGAAVGTHGLGVSIPDNAVITRAWYDVLTTFTDGDADATTIALQANAANDIVTAVAIDDGDDPWDAGRHGTKVGSGARSGNSETALVVGGSDAATFIKTTAERELTAVVAEEPLTAGRLVLFVEFMVSA